MSGQPYRYATDPAKYRQEYLNSLGIRADVDAMNLEANRVYKQTGQLPPMSQMADTRTTTEIYADVQKLKLGIIRDLAPIADSQFASQIVETMYSSPLNSNNKLIIFLAQRAPEIANNLKKLYSFKIKGDINDANVFVSFIEDMYNKSKASFASVESYFNKTGADADKGFTAEDITKIKETLLNTRKRINNLPINRVPTETRNIYARAIEDLIDSITQMVSVVPTTEQMKQFDIHGLQVSEEVAGNDSFVNHLRELHQLIKEELPRPDTLSSAIIQMEKTSINANPAEFNDAYLKVKGYLPSPATLKQIADITKYLTDEWKILVRRREVRNQEGFAGAPSMFQVGTDLLAGPPDRLETVEGVELGGNGLKKRGKGRPKGSGLARPFIDKVDKSKGIQPDKRYISFGKYLINTKKLNDDVIAIKRPSGANIIEFPSTRVSKNLSNVIKKIVGGKIPSFNELSELTDEEKHYLHKVSSKADIEDKFSIPAPSKDKLEKDMHSFEVMKGEIMAGNDNKDLIKKFKVLLMKLSRNGTLPKREVQEIMEDLIEMGF